MKHRVFPFVLGLSVALISAAAAVRGEEEPSELAQARAQYEKEVEFSTKPIRDRYLSRLETLKRTRGSRGDARAALAVQEEIDRVKQFSAQATGKGRFEGFWTIRYENGVVRKISIDANDVATMLEESTQPRNLKSKLVSKGGDVIVDWGDGTIEKMTTANAELLIQHFNPKTLYPKGPPSNRAVGTRTSPK